MRKTLYLVALCLLATGTNAVVTLTRSYPTVNQIPPTTSTEAKQWIAEIDLTAAAAKIPVVKCDSTRNSPLPGTSAVCDWTYDECTRPTDITTCPLGYWGLTYDDGPSTYSGGLYDFLEKNNQTATLFYIGSNVRTYPDAALRAYQAGHHIASHTWSHHASTCLTNEEFIVEVRWTETVIRDVTGITPKFFRPPYGDIDDRIRYLLTAMGYTAVIWDRDTNDWQIPEGKMTASTVEATVAKWVASSAKDTTGHISLEHEIEASEVAVAEYIYPELKRTYKVMNVADCHNLSYYASNSTNTTSTNTTLTRKLRRSRLFNLP